MKKRVLATLYVALMSPLLAASWLDRPPMPDEMLSDRGSIHQAVLALEQEPLHKNAELIRNLLVAYYKEVDYLICGDVLGPLSERKVLEPVMWQIIIASGDWVEENPDRANDIDAYTLVGLESGVRAYKNLLAVKPKAKHKLMDALLVMYENNTLTKWNAEHPCRPQ